MRLHLKSALRSACCYALIGFGATAQGAPIFNFTGPTGDAGNSVTSSAGGYTLTAYGFNANNTAHHLYYKNSGGDETGLGLVGTSDHELTLTYDGSTYANYIQIDVSQIYKAFPAAQILIGSDTGTESYDLFGSNTLGQIGTKIANSVGPAFNGKYFSIPNWGTYKFISVAVHPDPSHPWDNVLVGAIATTAVPEPGSALMLSTSLAAGLGLLSYRKIRTAVGSRRGGVDAGPGN
jgi:hypothetical protein